MDNIICKDLRILNIGWLRCIKFEKIFDHDEREKYGRVGSNY